MSNGKGQIETSSPPLLQGPLSTIGWRSFSGWSFFLRSLFTFRSVLDLQWVVITPRSVERFLEQHQRAVICNMPTRLMGPREGGCNPFTW